MQYLYICTTNDLIMATIKAFLRTSTKNKEVNIRIRITDGRNFSRYGITDIKILPEYWDDKKEEIKARVVLPEEYNRAQINDSVRNIKSKIELEYSKVSDKSLLPSDWIELILKDNSVDLTKDITLVDIFWAYYEQQKVSKSRKGQIKVAIGMLNRYLLYNNKVTFDKDDVNRLELFLLEEHKYQYIKPELYEKERVVLKRGRNTLNSKFKIIKAFFTWAVKEGYLAEHPFLKYEFRPDVYGDPIPLLQEEVDLIYKSKVPESLEVVRDMFCLQCYIGCRVGDFVSLKRENINEDILIYIANKTISEKAVTVYVPLIDNALSIIGKYNCDDGRLLPFINVNGKDGYNKKIKKLAEYLKLNRNVVVINPVTGKSENKKLYEVISSHTARKTFINSNYKETQDPKLISKMTGHSEKSQAFIRYRNIDMDILRDQMKKAFKKKEDN